MEKEELIKQLYKEYRSQKEHDKRLSDYIKFCEGCSTNLSEIPDKYPGFISIGYNPVAGIGFGTSELTKECQEKMRNQWSIYKEKLENIKNIVKKESVSEYSELVQNDRGHALNLYVNRCIITLHNKEVLAIANNADVRILYKLLKKTYIKTYDNKNIEWYENNKRIFDELAEILNVEEQDKPDLSLFGWYLKENLLQRSLLEKTLDNCHNIIFTGAPGTGKTYMAQDIVNNMGAEREFVQFHPSYDYTDFVEGLRPTKSAVSFERHDGIFKDLCKRAVISLLKGEDRKFVMIIDEINRGEISKIFGELFFSIDPGYRVEKGKLLNKKIGTYNDVKDFAIKTQYQNLIDTSDVTDPFRFGFFVPDNVYIIGTMNDIDRSVESMDFAMRRRFTFVEFTAGEHLGMLNKIDDYDTKKLAEVKMKALNDAIVNPQIGGLPQSYQIGGAYFVHINEYKDSDDKWEDLWEYHLKGLIYEYYRGFPDAPDKLKSLKEAFKKATIKQ